MRKIAIPLSMHETPLIVGARFASVEYQFRVVDKSDPEARRVNLVPRSDVVIEKTEKSTIDVTTKAMLIKVHGRRGSNVT